MRSRSLRSSLLVAAVAAAARRRAGQAGRRLSQPAGAHHHSAGGGQRHRHHDARRSRRSSPRPGASRSSWTTGPGANGIIGMEAVAKAKPDGYTWAWRFTSVLTINPHVYKTLPYDTFRDFAPISQAVTNTIVLIVHPSLPARSVKELVALAKVAPGTAQFRIVRHRQRDASRGRAAARRERRQDGARPVQGRDARRSPA